MERENPEFEAQLQERLQESFQQYQKLAGEGTPIGWQLLGIMIRPRAIAVCLTPQDEEAYKRIMLFRRAIYQNSRLIGLGIEQQYHFTAHITLGYFGEIPPDLNRDHLADVLSKISQEALAEESVPLCIRRAQLRKFDNMMRYYRQPDWPVLEF
jgi:hypothetical protein